MGFSRHDLAILAEMKQQYLIPDRGAIKGISAAADEYLPGRSVNDRGFRARVRGDGTDLAEGVEALVRSRSLVAKEGHAPQTGIA